MRYTVSSQEYFPRLGISNPTQAAVQGVALLLGTRQGSVPQYRDFGVPWDFLDRPPQIAKTLALSKVREAVQIYLPGVDVRSVSIRENPDMPGGVFLVAEIEF